MLRVWNWISTPPQNTPLSLRRYFVSSSFIFSFAFLIHFVFIFFFAALGVPEMTLFNVVSCVWFAIGIFVNRQLRLVSALLMCFVEVYAHAIACVHYFGWDAGYQYYMTLLPTGIFFLPPGKNIFKLSTAFVGACVFAAVYYYAQGRIPSYPIKQPLLQIINVSNIIFVAFFSAAFAYYFTSEARKAETSLEQLNTELALAMDKAKEEHKRSEDLLLNILPAPIAKRLKTTTQIIADGFEEVTILFADIVDFTSLASRISPEETVILLNEVFSSFDQLAEKYNLEKIKTIGDAYMLVGGLPEKNPDHAENVAQMALEMLQILPQFKTRTGESLAIRIGINTGPVVAGVIGKRKFIYDLWGDAVNTASRMESHGRPGRIQVTESTYEKLSDKFVFEARDQIQIKGKGLMTTYLLLGKLDTMHTTLEAAAS